MINLCKYKNLAGKPNTGLHKYRLFNIAIIDVILTIVASYLLYLLVSKINNNIKFYQVLIIVFILGILVHRLFCVKTTIDILLFS